MSFSISPGLSEISSPDVIMPDIRVNLGKQFENARDSINPENMRVYARIRPMLPDEEKKGHKVCIAAIDEKTVRALIPVSSSKFKSSRQKEDMYEDYTFTAAFGPESGQFEFFHDTMLDCMENFVESKNSLLFNYGITGSGKTYTLQGNSDNPGIIPLSLKLYFAVLEKSIMKEIVVKPFLYNDIVALSEADSEKEQLLRKQILSLYDEECDTAPGSFRNYNSKSFATTLCNIFYDSFEVEERHTTLGPEDMASAQAATSLKETIKKCAENQLGVCSVWISFIEIYNETVYDLLQSVRSNQRKLNLGEDNNGNVYIKGMREICVFNSDEALQLLNIGRKNLSIASTKMNYQSSRSHCIYTIRVVRVQGPDNINHGKVSRFSFCDLAGSERTSKTHTVGVRLKEASAINTSLLVLGRCLEMIRMNQMRKEKRMVPFRESKLTRIFSGFFMGQGKAVMIANASPSEYTVDETLHVLKFSATAKKLLVSSFLSDASSTIQSICASWATSKNNESMMNDSTLSDDSYSDVIQQKDEIIEKLLNLLENFEKKGKEMADFEWRIREEICDEWSEYSDELLEKQKIMYEEEKEAIRKVYQKRLDSMEKMYEKVMQGYKDQLSNDDEEESFASQESVDVSKSYEDLDVSTSSKLSPLKKPEELPEPSTLHTEVSKSPTLEWKLEIKELEKLLSSTRDELCASQELVQNKEFTIHELQSAMDSFKEQIKTLQNEALELKASRVSVENEIKDCRTTISTLEKTLKSSESSAIAANEKVRSQNIIISNLEKEIEAMKKCFQDLENETLELKASRALVENEIDDYKTTISTLKENLNSTESSAAATKEKMQDQIILISNLEKEINRYRSESDELRKSSREFKNYRTLWEADKEKLKTKISCLDQELQAANKTLGTVKREKELREEVSITLEREIDTLKQELKSLKENQQIEILEKTGLEEKVALLDGLKQNVNNLQQHIKKLEKDIEELEKRNKDREVEFEKLQKEKQNLLSSKMQLEEKAGLFDKRMEDLKRNQDSICLKLAEAENLNNTYKLEIKELQDEKKSLTSKQIELKDKLQKQIAESDQKTAEIAGYEAAVRKIKKYYEDSNTKLKNLQTEKLDLEREIDLHKSIIENRKNEIECCQAEVERIKKDYQDLESEKLSLAKEVDCHKAKIKELEGKISSKAVNNEAVIKIEKLSELEKEQEQDMKKLKEKLLLIEKEKEDLKIIISDNEKKIKDLTDKLSAVGGELMIAKEDIKKKHTAINDLKKGIETHSIEIGKIKDECRNIQIEKERLEKEIELYKAKDVDNSASEKLSSLIEEKKEYENEMAKLKKDLQMTEKEKENLLNVVSNNEKEIESCQTKLKELAAKEVDNSSLEKLSKLIEEKKEYENEMAKLKKNLQVTEKEKENLLDVISNNEKKMESYQAKLKELAAKEVDNSALEKLSKLIEEKKEYESEMSKLKKNLQVTEKEKENLLDVVSKNEKEIESYKAKLKELAAKEVDNSALEKLSKLIEEKKEYESEMSKLKKNLQVTEKEKENLLDVISKNEKEIESYQAKLKELAAKEVDNSALEKLSKLIEEKKEDENEMSKLKKNLLKTEKEKENLLDVISNNEKEIESYQAKLKEVHKSSEEKLSKLIEERKDCENEMSKLKKNLQVTKKEYENETTELKRSLQVTEKEKENLLDVISNNEKKMESYQAKLKELEAKEVDNSALEKLSQLIEEKKEYENEMAKLKKNLQVTEKEKENLLDVISNNEKEIESYQAKLKELAAKEVDNSALEKLSILIEEKNEYEKEMEKLKKKLQVTEKEKENLLDVISKNEKEIESYQAKLKELAAKEVDNSASEKLSKLIEEKKEHENEMSKLKKNLLKTEKEKENLLDVISNNEKEIESYQAKLKELASKEVDNSALEKLSKLILEKKEYENEMKKLKKKMQVTEIEKENLLTVISDNEKKIGEMKDNLDTAKDELEAKRKEIVEKTTTIDDLKKILTDFNQMLVVLEKCEMHATLKVKHLNYAFFKQRAQNSDLVHRIRKSESSLEKLKTGLTDSKKELKGAQTTWNQKMLEEKDQYGVEIEQTLKFKKEIEVENEKLKEENIKLRKFSKPAEVKETQKNEKGAIPKAPSQRSLRQKRTTKKVSLKDISSSSIESEATGSSELEIPKPKSRKRVSDDDFDVDQECSKKMKTVEKTKIPVRKSRRKVETDLDENPSPIKRAANAISHRFKTITENVVGKISPRETRGRKKLYNPDSSSSLKSQKVTKRKK